jgi:hypothetical protein
MSKGGKPEWSPSHRNTGKVQLSKISFSNILPQADDKQMLYWPNVIKIFGLLSTILDSEINSSFSKWNTLNLVYFLRLWLEPIQAGARLLD